MTDVQPEGQPDTPTAKPISEAARLINAQVAMMNLFGIDTFTPCHDTPGGCGDRREF